jgi:hypothetical protein
MPVDHPLTKASWIWPGGAMYVYNQFAQFRKEFELDSVPDRAPFHITADKSYKLYVNGIYVCRGPARGYQNHWPFDTIDVGPLLRKGKNWISVLAYNPGIGTFQYIHRSSAGFLCALDLTSQVLISDRSWKMRRMPGVRTLTARYSLQLDFQEQVDLNLTDTSWIDDRDYSPDWNDAPEKRISWDECFAFGRAPYDTVEERGIPLLQEEWKEPGVPICTAAGPNEDNRAEPENISWQWVREAGKVEKVGKWETPGPGLSRMTDGRLELDIPSSGKGNYIAVTFDAGEYLLGTIAVEIENAVGNEIVDIQHHENIVGGRPAIRKEGDACQIALANRLILRPGKNSHEFFHLMGFHYATIIVRNSTTSLRLRIRIHTAGYPFTMNGEFRCSDEMLNRIHDACRRTQAICSLDAYMDTPWREQAQWWGDARIQAKNTFFLDGDSRLLARGIRSIAGQTTIEGLTYGHAPTIAYNCILPDFSLTWILTIWDYFWQTGDISLFREQWPVIQRVLGYFDGPHSRSSTGLLRHDRRFWYFGDWADLFKGEIPTLLNLWYLVALDALCKLLAQAGMRKEGRKAEKSREKHSLLVRKFLFDPEVGFFSGGLDEYGKQSGPISLHDQAAAIMAGLASESEISKMCGELFLPFLWGDPVAAVTPSAFWVSYLLEEMGRRDFGNEVVAFISRKWTPMLSTGTTWEGFEWSETNGNSASHAWTSHPCFHFVNILAGIRQAGAGWSRIEFFPVFAPDMDRVSAKIPSPRGMIEAGWERKGKATTAFLRIPAGVTADVRLEGKKQTIKGPQNLSLSL